jgi:hypothetical protein
VTAALRDTSDVSAKFLHPADCSRIAKMVVTGNPKPVKDDAVTKNLFAIVAAFGAAK